MKRILSFVMSLVILTTCTFVVPASAAASIDYSYIKSQSDLYTFDVNDSGSAFIDVDIIRPSFTHKNSPEGYDSIIYSDIIILDYYTSPEAVWRLWIDYAAKKNLGISSVTFQYLDAEYTFDVASNVKTTRNDNVVTESFPIVLGSENFAFWFLLQLELERCKSYSDMEKIHIPVTLHGAIDDVTFEMPTDGLVDLYFLGEAMINMVQIEGILGTEGTKMTTVNK